MNNILQNLNILNDRQNDGCLLSVTDKRMQFVLTSIDGRGRGKKERKKARDESKFNSEMCLFVFMYTRFRVRVSLECRAVVYQ